MRRSIITLAIVATLVSSAWAVKPATWRQSTEAEFTPGQFTATAVNSRGEIALAREITVLMSSKEAPAVVSAMVVVDNTIYAAAGPDPAPGAKGAIYKIVDKTVTKFATLPTVYVTTLASTPAGLLAGAGGQGAGIYAIGKQGTALKLWSDQEVKYVWAIVPGAGNTLYAATGPKGRVYEIDAKAGTGKVVYDAGALVKNILCLARRADGTLCAGTDEKGLVIEIDPKAKTGRVILNANEKEIASIVTAQGGGYFVATSDTSKANADGKVAPTTSKNGKAATTAPAPPTAPKTAPETNDKDKKKPAPAPKRAPATPAKPAPKVTISMPGMTGPGGLTTRSPATASPGLSGPGNAIYYIQSDGLARTIFRKPLTILAMIRLTADELVLATGNGGGIYSVTIDGDLVTQLADTDAKQVTAVGLTSDGRIAFATANAGSVGTLAATRAAKGTYVSKAQDAKQFARWGAVEARLDVPGQCKATFATRSGNLEKPDDATWSPWSAEQPLKGEFLQIASPPARFLQYRLTLHADKGASPTVHDVDMAYQVGNLAPAVSAVKITAVAQMGPVAHIMGPKVDLAAAMVFRQLAIAAADPNGDAMMFTVAYRGVSEETWITLTDKLTAPAYFWNTQTVADGKYELRITASDKPANAAAAALEAVRISEPVTVDNTPPAVARLAGRVRGNTVTLTGEAVDALSRIQTIQYSIDSDTEWLAVIAGDGITDSPRETFSFDVKDVKPGHHRIAVRAIDALGNTGYAAATITVGK